MKRISTCRDCGHMWIFSERRPCPRCKGNDIKIESTSDIITINSVVMLSLLEEVVSELKLIREDLDQIRWR